MRAMSAKSLGLALATFHLYTSISEAKGTPSIILVVATSGRQWARPENNVRSFWQIQPLHIGNNLRQFHIQMLAKIASFVFDFLIVAFCKMLVLKILNELRSK